MLARFLPGSVMHIRLKSQMQLSEEVGKMIVMSFIERETAIRKRRRERGTGRGAWEVRSVTALGNQSPHRCRTQTTKATISQTSILLPTINLYLHPSPRRQIQSLTTMTRDCTGRVSTTNASSEKGEEGCKASCCGVLRSRWRHFGGFL